MFPPSSTELTFLPKWTGRGSKVVRATQQWINLPPKVDRKRKLRFSGPPINELILLSKWTGRGSKVFRPTQQWIDFPSKVDRKRIKGFPAHPPRQWILSQGGPEKEARFSGQPNNQLIFLSMWTGNRCIGSGRKVFHKIPYRMGMRFKNSFLSELILGKFSTYYLISFTD